MSNVIRIRRGTFDKKPDPRRLRDRLEVLPSHNGTFAIDRVTLLDEAMVYSRETLETFATREDAQARYNCLLAAIKKYAKEHPELDDDGPEEA